MRLLFVSNDFPNRLSPTKGLFNFELAKALAQTHDVTVVSPIAWTDEWQAWQSKSGSVGTRTLKSDGVEVHYPRYLFPPKVLREHYGLFYRMSVARSVRAVLRQGRPDFVLSYWVHPDGEAAVAVARRVGVPAGVIVGGSDVLLITQNSARRRQVCKVLEDMDVIFTVSRHLRQAVIDLGIPSDKVRVWEQGVDQTIFSPGDKLEATARLRIDPEPPALLWVGRLVPVKGLEILIAGCALLRDRGVDFRLYLVGDGPLKGEVERHVRATGLESKVRLVGPRQPEQLGDWFRASDVVVLTSWSEGLPNVLREAAACGKRFVASDVGGICEIAGPDDRLFPKGDAGALAEALAQSLASPPAQIRVRSKSWIESAGDLTGMLTSVVLKRSPAGAA